MLDYANNEIKFSQCPCCGYAKGEFSLPCGMIYQNEDFTISQDWELPIAGFIVVCPVKKHVEKLSELSDDTVSKMYKLIKCIEKVLIENNIAERFSIIFEEKKGVHLHVWIMPLYNWMMEITNNDPVKHISGVFKYAKNNFRNEETYKEIQRIVNILKIRIGAYYDNK